MKSKKFFSLLLTAILLSTTFSISINAASGYQGYAIYRDGVAEIEWHAGIMHKPYNTYSLPVVHHRAGDEYVQWDSWSNFLEGNKFIGYYKPIGTVSSSTRDLFVSMSDKLVTEIIPYTLFYQVKYDTGTSGTWVDPNDIIKMRCDGVVEYIYEWYGYRVFGPGDEWDITLNNYWNLQYHSLYYTDPVTPKIQALYYLTNVPEQ